MSLIPSMTSVTGAAGRVAHDVRESMHRARVEGEKRVLERRHRRALAALGARARELARDGAIAAGALDAEIAEVDARQAEVDAARTTQASDDTGHDATTAFPMLAEDETG